MRRFFVKNILFVVAVNILVKPIWVLFIDRIVQNRLPAASYGTYTALLSLSIIFQTVLDFGISSYNSRTIAQNPDKLPILFPTMLSVRLVLIMAYTLGVAFIDWRITHSIAQFIGIIYSQQYCRAAQIQDRWRTFRY